MSLLPQATLLGDLEIIEVYEFYDKPCLFSCENKSGQVFLALWIDETLDSDSWLYVPTSSKRFQEIASGRVELREAYVQAEDNFVIEVTIPQNGNAQVMRLQCENIGEDKLPEKGEFLSCRDLALVTTELIA